MVYNEKEYKKKWRKEHKKEIKEYNKMYRQKNKEKINKQAKEYRQRPEVKKKNEKYNQSPERKKQKKKSNQKPERKEYQKEYRQRPEMKLYRKGYDKVYRKANKEKRKEYDKERWKKLVEKENKRRKKIGLPLVGEGFKSEMELLVYVHKLFGNYDILTHHRKIFGDWGLQGLELDIYIPKLKLAFEYMGEQHYTFIPFLHPNIKQFESQQYRDKCKKKLCKLKGITLIHIKYDKKLSEQLILSKLKYLPIKTSQEVLKK